MQCVCIDVVYHSRLFIRGVVSLWVLYVCAEVVHLGDTNTLIGLCIYL